MSSIPETPTVVRDIVDNADERELWIVGREFERPPYFHAGKGGDTRLARALRVCVENRIMPQSDGTYMVEGSEHRTYRVGDSCSCPNSQKAQSRWCYHAVAVALYIEWQRRLKPTAPVALGTLRAGTLPLPPTTVDERLAQPTDDLPLIAPRDESPVYETSEDTRYTMPKGAIMADDAQYIPEPDDAPGAIAEPPVATPALRPVLLPSLDARTLEQSMQAWSAQRQVVKRFLQQELKEGVDFYSLRIKGRETKPTLSKAGAEKFLGLFQLQASFETDLDTWEMLGKPTDLILYTCRLKTRSGEVVGEGRGARSLKQDGGDTNKALKMSEKCLGGTTPVLIKTSQGINLVRLNDLVHRPLETTSIAGPGGTWRKLIRVDAQPSGPVRRLRFRDGFVVKASLNHRWPLLDGTFKTTADLRLGDVIPHSPLPVGERHSDPDFLWMAGLYIAEGSIQKEERNLIFSLHADEEGIAEHLIHIAERIGASASTTVKGNKRSVWLFGPAPVGLVQHFVEGRLSYGKHFRRSFWQQDPKGLKAGLMGYLVGDGCLQEKGHRQPIWQLGFTRQNHELAHDLRVLCAMLGYRCRLDHSESRETTTNKRFPIYKGWLKMAEPRYNASEPGEIIAIDETAEVTYEVEVDGDHLFCLANGLVTHNSALIDAVLRTGALSEVFTQDAEDMQEPEPVKAATPAKPTSQDLRQRIWAHIYKAAPQIKTQIDAVNWIKEHTGMDMHPDCYQAIADRLEA